MQSFLNEADKTAYAGRLRMEDVAGLALFSEALRDAGRGASETARAAIGADFQNATLSTMTLSAAIPATPNACPVPPQGRKHPQAPAA